LRVGIKRLTNMSGELLSGIGKMFDKGRIMALDDLVEQRLLGAVALVTNTAHFHTARPRRLHKAKRQGRSQEERRQSVNGLSAGRK